MKISASELSQIIAEELQETDWRDTGSSDYHKPQAKAGPYAEEHPKPLQVVTDMLMEVHSLLEEELDSGDYEMHEEQKIDQISEVAYSMYQQLMHIIEGSMSE